MPTGDVNRDGRVSILDLILVAQQLGKRVPPNSPVDINGDGVVNIFDLTLVAQGIGKSTAAAPAVATGRVDAATIEAWIAGARLADDGSIAFRQGIANLESVVSLADYSVKRPRCSPTTRIRSTLRPGYRTNWQPPRRWR